MHFHHIPLAFSPEQTAALRHEQTELAKALENNRILSEEQLHRLRSLLFKSLDEQPGANPGTLARLRDDIRPNLLHLSGHHDDELLNLPWHLVAEGCPNLSISKGLALRENQTLETFSPDLPLPLKVLVMVAAPDSGGARLDYEAEEKIILDALSPLMRSGEVEVDFCDDGSLESLRRALAANRYHVLYFSGHSAFGARNIGDAPEATLLLEDELSMQARPTSAAEFAAVLAADPSRQPALVLLSSCQSGQGNAEGGFRGVAHRLMQGGIPAVIAMGWSVTDFWATHFAGAFFKSLAGREPLGSAFNRALESGRKQFVSEIPPLFFQSQSLIPQLFFTKQVEHLVRWDSKAEKRLSRAGETLLKGNDRLAAKLRKVNSVFGREGKDLLFIGRRRERKEALRMLREGRSVLLRGQGGMGKTALALHLAWRQLVADPDHCVPLAFDQTTLSLENLCNALLDYLEVDAQQRTMRSQIAAIEKQWDKFFHLLENFEKVGVKPFFIFDNLETFQSTEEPGGPLRPEMTELLGYMLTRLGYPVLCTGRYPLQEFDEETLHLLNMNEAPAGDFRQKCLHLPALPLLAVEGRSFDEVAATLHQSMGGNYRALENFDELCRENPQDIPGTLAELENLLRRYTGETLRRMSEDLVFDKLLALLNPAEHHALLLLAGFRRPVLPFAVEGQDTTLVPADVLLARVADLTLAERREGEVAERNYFFVPPLVRELLEREGVGQFALDDEQAGAYYEQAQEMNRENTADHEEAFFHYEQAGNVEKVNEIGNHLSSFYYEVQQFQRSLGFAMRTEVVAGEKTVGSVLNILGFLFKLSGKLEAALHFLERSLAVYHRNENRNGEGTTMNNISQIYQAKGDYVTALSYLQQSLKIYQEIGDRAGEGRSLNNTSQIYQARGDYDTALSYLQQSLKIMQEIGDRKGESTTIGNIASIHFSKGDYDKAIEFFQKDLKTCQEIGDRAGEGTTLNNISPIYKARGDYDTALSYLQQSLKIMQEIGDRAGEGSSLNNIGQIYRVRGDYETAFSYFQRSLKIRLEIGDRAGEGTMLNNIGRNYGDIGDYDTALSYLQLSLKIRQEIGDRAGEGVTLNNLATTAHAKGDYDTALTYLQQSLKIQQEIGDIYGEAATLTNMGAMLFEQNHLEESIPLLLQAYQILEKIGSPDVKAPESYLNAIIERIGQARFEEIVRGRG